MSSPVAGSTRISILLPDLRGGGAERVSVNLVNELVRRGLSVDLVLMRVEGQLLESVDAKVRIVDLRAPRVRHVLIALIGYLKRSRPAGMVAHMWPLTVIAVLAKVLSRASTRLVLVEHTNWSASEISISKRRLLFVGATMRVLFPFADSRVAVSNGARLDMAKISGLPPACFAVLNNPVVGAEIPKSASLGAVADEWWNWKGAKIIAVGALRKDKDFATLLRAFARLLEQVDARLLILGEGSLRGELEAMARDLGVSARLSMPGFVADPSHYFARADLFTLSSTAEGLPTVIIEALAQGTPVVSTDCPSGPREILEGGRLGTLVPMGDAETFVAAIHESLSKSHDRDALRARAQDFSVDKATNAYLDLLLPGWRGQPLILEHS
jgi:glycosyltransferase involved in cell wall biosynthesis